MISIRLALAVALSSFTPLFAGCASRAHLTPTHGRAYSEAFGRQTVNPHPTMDTRSTQGLDSQEASVVARSYRHSLAAHDSGDAANQSMVMTTPGAGAQASTPYLPPPSVPQGQ